MGNVHSLDKRLSLIASFVRPGSRLVDVGTDHAYLPVWLVGQEICPHAIATDIRPGPAARAAETVAAAGLDSRIAVRLGDGLAPVIPDEADDIVIAGMGGETIAGILESAPWTKDGRLHLILQPMSKPEVLHEYLLTNGFSLMQERVAVDVDRLYPILLARFDPETARVQAIRPAAFIRGEIDVAEGRAYLEKQGNRLTKAADALRRAGKAEEAGRLEQLAAALLS